MRLETITATSHYLNATRGSILFSYDTPIACYDSKKNVHYVDEKYSTRDGVIRKHINAFTLKKYEVVSSGFFNVLCIEILSLG